MLVQVMKPLDVATKMLLTIISTREELILEAVIQVYITVGYIR